MQVRQEMSAVLPEISVRAMNAEQLGQLRADQEQRDAALEAGHHAFGNEVHDRAGLDRHAINAMSATSNAVAAANPANREASPLAIPEREEPISTEMADVTVMTVCRELQNSQKTKPPNKHA